MEKRPPGAKQGAPPKAPAGTKPARPAKQPDTLLAADGSLEPVNRTDEAPPEETEMFDDSPDETGADEDAADFLLGGGARLEDDEAEAPPKKSRPQPDVPLGGTRPVVEQQQPPGKRSAPKKPDAAAADGAESGTGPADRAEDADLPPRPGEAEETEEHRAAPAAAPAARPEPGKAPTLGDFKLLKKLGQGGMGTVYLAEQQSLRRQVAVKVLSKELAAKPAFVQRFLREARVMARLDHPNILRCHDVKAEQGHHFLAMEYVDGGSLETWLRKLGKFSVGDALHVILACARALEHAHELKLIHRDIKPDNLLLTRKGVVKLADLGLAKASDDDLSLTRTGTGAGTPLYMAPEQARNAKHVDARVDIYALGSMLYCFLTGRPPFAGETLVEVIEAKEKGKFTPARRLNPDVPQRLDLILDKMLAANPAHRHQTCAEVIHDLEELGLANESLSFLGESPGGGAAKPAPARPKPAAERPARVSEKPAPIKTGPEAWYVELKLPGGKTVTKKATAEEVQTLIKSGSVAADTNVSRTPKGGFRALATYAEFEPLLRAHLTKAKADRKAEKFRKMYDQIEKEEARRGRWRWVYNLVSSAGGIVRFLIWVAVVLGLIAGLIYGGWWLLQFLADKWNLK